MAVEDIGLRYSDDETEKRILRRRFMKASAGAAGAVIGGAALGETLVYVPPRGRGDNLGPHSERSKFATLYRIPEGILSANGA